VIACISGCHTDRTVQSTEVRIVFSDGTPASFARAVVLPKNASKGNYTKSPIRVIADESGIVHLDSADDIDIFCSDEIIQSILIIVKPDLRVNMHQLIRDSMPQMHLKEEVARTLTAVLPDRANRMLVKNDSGFLGTKSCIMFSFNYAMLENYDCEFGFKGIITKEFNELAVPFPIEPNFKRLDVEDTIRNSERMFMLFGSKHCDSSAVVCTLKGSPVADSGEIIPISLRNSSLEYDKQRDLIMPAPGYSW